MPRESPATQVRSIPPFKISLEISLVHDRREYCFSMHKHLTKNKLTLWNIAIALLSSIFSCMNRPSSFLIWKRQGISCDSPGLCYTREPLRFQ